MVIEKTELIEVYIDMEVIEKVKKNHKTFFRSVLPSTYASLYNMYTCVYAI